MKRSQQFSDELLLQYLDGTLEATQKESLVEALKSNDVLKNRLEQLADMNRIMRSGLLEQPSRNFTQMVMARLHQYPSQVPGYSIRNGILLLAGVLVAAGIASFLISTGVFDHATATVDLGEINLPQKYFQYSLPSIPFNGKVMVHIIVILNLGLAWLVLDRAILKPLFQRRMQGGH